MARVTFKKNAEISIPEAAYELAKKNSMIQDIDQQIRAFWDDGEITEAEMITVLITKIRELIAEVNRLKRSEQK
jgi:hypothetical protein